MFVHVPEGEAIFMSDYTTFFRYRIDDNIKEGADTGKHVSHEAMTL